MINLPDIVGKGYGTFWRFKGRYRVVKGSRASKKSKTTALWYIVNLMKYKEANLLVVRKSYRTLKNSCFSDLKWAINQLGVNEFWEFKESELKIIYKPTGQVVLFRGLDDPLKVTSISVDKGCLCWLWIEEAYEINKEDDFNILDESIRGEVPEGLFKQITICLNPWNDKHWIKSRFFDIMGNGEIISEDGNVLAMTTNYKCNEWLDKSDLKVFEDMKKRNPKRYRVAGLGEWGIVDGLVYENYREQEYKKEEVKDLKVVCGLDYGYTNDPTAFFVGFLDKDNKKLFVWDELYKKGLSNKRIAEEITLLGYAKEKITADSAEPKSNDELNYYGLRVTGAKKGKDSIMNGIQWIQELEIIIHPRCTNFITEIGNYAWDKDKFGNSVNKPVDDFNHLMDAMRYALEKYILGDRWIY